MTINDFTYFAIYNGYLYIYQTPSDNSYTLQVMGSELQDEVTVVGDVFPIDAELGWGLVYKALEKIAEINGNLNAALVFERKGSDWEKKAKIKAEKKNYIKDRIRPYSLL